MESALCDHPHAKTTGDGKGRYCPDCFTHLPLPANPDSIWPPEIQPAETGKPITYIEAPIATQYVVGFFFSVDYQHVVLIEKLKPAWQKGKLNGVGGKIEPGETPEQAMQREFREEAGLDVVTWRKFCVLKWRGGEVHFFTATGDVYRVYSATEEIIRRIKVEHLEVFQIIPNLRWLVPMAADGNIGMATVEDIS